MLGPEHFPYGSLATATRAPSRSYFRCSNKGAKLSERSMKALQDQGRTTPLSYRYLSAPVHKALLSKLLWLRAARKAPDWLSCGNKAHDPQQRGAKHNIRQKRPTKPSPGRAQKFCVAQT
jgi:hypothetical protein